AMAAMVCAVSWLARSSLRHSLRPAILPPPAEASMRFQLHKYWRDLLMPVLRQDQPPTVPQAIVLQDQQVLLVQRDHPRFWELPGGSMAPGETPEETVVREVWEETSVHVEIVEL